MRKIWKTIRYNLRYIIATSNKIVVFVFSVWGFITLVTPTDMMLESIDNILLRIITASLILIAIYLAITIGVTIYVSKKRTIKLFDLHSGHSLFVEYGDLFLVQDSSEERNIVFAGNRCFDTIVDDDLIGSKKIHGIALNRLYQNGERDADSVSNEIQSDLSIHGYKHIDIERKEKRKGNLRRYEVGAVAEISGLYKERYFILGLTSFDSELRAHVEKEDYLKALASLVKYISERSQEFPTYMPVVGAGGSDVGNVNELIKYIIKTIEMFKDEIDCDIHIIVSNKEENLGLLNLKLL